MIGNQFLEVPLIYNRQRRAKPLGEGVTTGHGASNVDEGTV